ncbi:MAG TPA: molybdenum cofactor guanylyltransferase MobA [Methylocella sp.]|nr:molybdenum cofactor guanylyltransferase MobA [Methylocella sp.]
MSSRRADAMQPGDCIGILLAGGRARRMGGRDKALEKLGGAPLLAWAIAALRPQCAGLVISANGDLSRFAASGVPAVADSVPAFRGPLAGILAGLDWIAASRPDIPWALSAPADTPFLPGDLAARLAAARRAAGAPIACASSGGRLHPAVALWPVAIREDLRQALLEKDIRKVDAFASLLGRAAAEWPATPFDPFFNINEPGDLAQAEALLARMKSRLRSPALSIG